MVGSAGGRPIDEMPRQQLVVVVVKPELVIERLRGHVAPVDLEVNGPDTPLPALVKKDLEHRPVAELQIAPGVSGRGTFIWRVFGTQERTFESGLSDPERIVAYRSRSRVKTFLHMDARNDDAAAYGPGRLTLRRETSGETERHGVQRHLEVDRFASQLARLVLEDAKQSGADPATNMLRIDVERVDPRILPCHLGETDDPILDLRHQDDLLLDRPQVVIRPFRLYPGFDLLQSVVLATQHCDGTLLNAANFMAIIEPRSGDLNGL